MLRLHHVALLSWLKLKLSERTLLEIWQFWIKSKELHLLVIFMPLQEKELNSSELNLPELSEQNFQLTKKPNKSSKSKRENKTSHLESLDLEPEWLLDYLNFNIWLIFGVFFFFDYNFLIYFDSLIYLVR